MRRTGWEQKLIALMPLQRLTPKVRGGRRVAEEGDALSAGHDKSPTNAWTATVAGQNGQGAQRGEVMSKKVNIFAIKLQLLYSNLIFKHNFQRVSKLQSLENLAKNLPCLQ